MMEDGVVVARGRMKASEGHLQVIAGVVLQQQALNISFKLSAILFRENHLAEDARPVRQLRGQEEIHVTDGKVSRRAWPESKRRTLLGRTCVTGFICDGTKALEPDAANKGQRLRTGNAGLRRAGKGFLFRLRSCLRRRLLGLILLCLQG